MGRPIQKKFFGNTNVGGSLSGTGGESFANILQASAGSGYSTSGSVTWAAIAAIPGTQLPGALVASGTVTVNGSGVPTAFNLVSSGGGYLNTTTIGINVTPTPSSTGTFAIGLTTSNKNALTFLAWVPTATGGTSNTGGSSVAGDIERQVGTKRYYVTTAQGYGVCALTTGTVTQGTMTLIATEWNGNTYWVTRLASKKARLYQKTQNAANAWTYNTGDLAKWTINAATGTDKTSVTTVVSIANA